MKGPSAAAFQERLDALRLTPAYRNYEFVRSRVLCRSAGAAEERVSCRAGEIERGSERADGFHVRATPLATLERAHGVHRETGDRREFLLREARGLAEGLELRPKRARSAQFHCGSILPLSWILLSVD